MIWLLLVLWMGSPSPVWATDRVPNYKISGSIRIAPALNPKGRIFLILTPEGANAFARLPDQPKDGGGPVDPPVTVVQDLGSPIRDGAKFQLEAANGRYTLGCIIKVQGRCHEIQVDGAKRLGNCYPNAEDLICAGRRLEVSGKDIENLILSVGTMDRAGNK